MSDTWPEYSDRVVDHFRNPRNVGDMENPDGMGRVQNDACGDITELYIRVSDNVITEARFRTLGCAAAIAASSMLTEMVRDKSIEQAQAIDNDAIMQALDGFPLAKVHCSLLATEALHLAIDDYLEGRSARA